MEDQTYISAVLSNTPVIDWMITLGVILTIVGLASSAFPAIVGTAVMLLGIGAHRFFKHSKKSDVKRNGWHKMVDYREDDGKADGYTMFFLLGYEMYRRKDYTTRIDEDTAEVKPSGGGNTVDGTYYYEERKAQEQLKKIETMPKEQFIEMLQNE